MSPARGGDGSHEDQLAEMEDEMYSLKQQLEEEQDRASELEAELSKLRAKGGGGGVGSELHSLQLEVQDLREAKERAERLLDNALGGTR